MVISKYIFMLMCLNSGVLSSNVSTAFVNAKISPDTIETPPEGYLHVEFAGGNIVDLGNPLTVPQTGLLQPSVTYDADPDANYTLVMIDPDSIYPEGPLKLPGQHIHWGVGNIKGNNISSGDVFVVFQPPLAPPLSSRHRYTLVVYQQPGKQHFEEILEVFGFDIKKFVKKHKLGTPKFGNFFSGLFA